MEKRTKHRHIIAIQKYPTVVFFLSPGEPLHGYRVCIQAVLQDKPKLATENLPEVSECGLDSWAYCDFHAQKPFFFFFKKVAQINVYNILTFLSSIWSYCDQFRIVQWSVWLSCGLSVKLDFTTWARAYKVIHSPTLACVQILKQLQNMYLLIISWKKNLCCISANQSSNTLTNSRLWV